MWNSFSFHTELQPIARKYEKVMHYELRKPLLRYRQDSNLTEGESSTIWTLVAKAYNRHASDKRLVVAEQT